MSLTPPTLPQHAPDPARRAEALAAARDSYAYDYGYQSLCFVKSLPSGERFSPRYMAQGAAAAARLKANRAAYAAAGHALETKLTRAKSLADFDAMYPALDAPAVAKGWRDDALFAWQRVAGAVPTILTGVDRLPDHFPVTDGHFAQALPGDSLAAARAEGRLFLVDYAVFADIPCGRYPPDDDNGLRKYLPAPLALFCATPSARGGLAPVAIQCGQRPDRDPVVTPADRARWQAAKLAVQVADANYEGITAHFAETHLVMEAFILAARRCLSPDHPVLRLLAPHFEFTLAANQYARESLVVVGGTQDRILAPLLPATHEVLRATLRAVNYDDLDPTRDAARRRVATIAALPQYPFRDDGEDLWAATRRWVASYLALYYASDADAAADFELRAMVDEVASPDGGRLPRLVAGARTDTVTGIADLVARVVHRASGHHAAINYNWWDWMGHAPNAPSVCVAPVPDAPADESALLAMLPPMGAAWETIEQIFNVKSIAANRLGEYPDGFADPRVAPLRAVYARELADVEARAEARDATRLAPYGCMRPSRVTASINS